MNKKKKKKKEMIPLTNEENNYYEKQEACYICKKEFSNDGDYKKYQKVRDHYNYTGKFRAAAYSICNLTYRTLKEVSILFHDGSTYDYHFIVNQIAKKCEGKFECLGENI